MLASWLSISKRMDANLGDAGLKADSRSSASLQYLVDQGKFRLIDVHEKRLVAVRGSVKYLALSYVWGQAMQAYSSTHEDTASTLHESRMGDNVSLDMKPLPRTIRDAVRLTEMIGERYIWVDALCIDQTDNNDRGIIVRHMSAIYSNAILTIVAACGTSADDGLTRLNGNSSDLEQSVSFINAGEEISLLPAPHSKIHDLVRFEHWFSRGWTMQEQLLSTACVYFTTERVGFICRSFETDE